MILGLVIARGCLKYLLGDFVLLEGGSADRAEEGLVVSHEMSDEVEVAILVELVIGPALQLDHLLASYHLVVAESALFGLVLHGPDDGVAQTTLDALDKRLVRILGQFLVLANRLLSHE